MKHARADYQRIQDLAEVIRFLQEEGLCDESWDDFKSIFLPILEDRYGPLNVEPIPFDEPVFLLRGQDITAAETVLDWVGNARVAGAKTNILATAIRQAAEMLEWGCQIPDMPREK